MNWEFLVFAVAGWGLALWYVIREWLVWRDAQRRRRIPLYGYRLEASRPNLRRAAR